MNDKKNINDIIGSIDLIVYCENIDREYPIAVIDSQEPQDRFMWNLKIMS